MCGIAGFLSTGGFAEDEAAHIARRMADALVHRGPDDVGVWVEKATGVALANRRLAVLDLSSAGRQPMVSASGRYVIVFNGEIYNHLELRQSLEASKAEPAWRGHSDTETLLAAIEYWSVTGTLQRSVGMFALAVWDSFRRELWLARDRMGEKPLYYGWRNGVFLFASELNALKAHPAFRTEVDRAALALLLRYNYIPTPYSICHGMRKMPPAHVLRVRAGTSNDVPEPYWSLPEICEQADRNPHSGSDEEVVGALEALLAQSVRGQMLSDVPLGVLLSGGVDSSTVTALMQSQSSRPVRTFTVGFREPDYNEAGYAAAVARHLGTEHTELYVTAQDALDVIPRLPRIYDEPFADSSQIPTFLVAEFARRHVTVALSGDGGDELFGGYNRYLLALRAWRAFGVIPFAARRIVGRALLAASPAGWDAATRWITPFRRPPELGLKLHKLGRRLIEARDLDDFYQSLVTEWTRVPLVDFGSNPRSLIEDRARWPAVREPIARMVALDALTYLPDDILVKVDRAAMHVSLETRAPYLDHRVVEFAARIPVSKKIRSGVTKWPLRQVLYRYVPRVLIVRPKMGFGIPLDAWLRGSLREWAENLLDETRLRREGYFDPRPVRDAWGAHLAGQPNGYRLWSVLMFQAWLEHHAAMAHA